MRSAQLVVAMLSLHSMAPRQCSRLALEVREDAHGVVELVVAKFGVVGLHHHRLVGQLRQRRAHGRAEHILQLARRRRYSDRTTRLEACTRSMTKISSDENLHRKPTCKLQHKPTQPVLKVMRCCVVPVSVGPIIVAGTDTVGAATAEQQTARCRQPLQYLQAAKARFPPAPAWHKHLSYSATREHLSQWGGYLRHTKDQSKAGCSDILCMACSQRRSSDG